jgi:hypothetical protein
MAETATGKPTGETLSYEFRQTNRVVETLRGTATLGGLACVPRPQLSRGRLSHMPTLLSKPIRAHLRLAKRPRSGKP